MKRQPLLSTRLPYLLYFMRDDKAELVREENKQKAEIYYDNQKVEYQKMHPFFIFLLKHLIPILFLIAVVDISIFKAIDNWLIPFVLFLLVLPSFYIFKYKRHFTLFYFVGLIFLSTYVSMKMDYLVHDINFSFTIVTLVLAVVFITYDMYMTYKYYTYFFIKDVVMEVGYRTGQRKLTLGFWKLKKTFNFKSGSGKTLAKIRFIGTFVKVPNTIDWGSK